MEIILRGITENDKHDLLFKSDKSGNVTLTMKSKNGTGEYTVKISSEDFDFLCRVREMLINDNKQQ